MRKPKLPQKLRTPQELAAALGIAYSTAAEYCRNGWVKTIRIGKLHRISEEEFQRVLVEGLPNVRQKGEDITPIGALEEAVTK